jgi:hypothetical protein
MKIEDQERNSGRGGNRSGERRNISSRRGGPDFNPAENLDLEARRKGGQRSAEMQLRDASGHFAGKRNQEGASSTGSRSRGSGR